MTPNERERQLRALAEGDHTVLNDLLRDGARHGTLNTVYHALSIGVATLTMKLEYMQSTALKLGAVNDQHETAVAKANGEKFVVRLYDGGEHLWMDVTAPLSHEEAQTEWNRRTKQGTKNTRYGDFDYYKVFPANTRMAHRSGD
jgi:hypothetical protein